MKEKGYILRSLWDFVIYLLFGLTITALHSFNLKAVFLVIGIGFDDEGSILGLDEPEREQRRIFDATRGIENLDWKARVLKNEEEKRGLMLMVARGEKPILTGETMIIRDGSSFRPANAKEVIEFTQRLQTTQGGHLWLKSLRNFKLNKEKK